MGTGVKICNVAETTSSNLAPTDGIASTISDKASCYRPLQPYQNSVAHGREIDGTLNKHVIGAYR